VHVTNYQVAFPIQPLKWMIKFQMIKHLSQKNSLLTWSFRWEMLVCTFVGVVWSSQPPQHSSLPCPSHWLLQGYSPCVCSLQLDQL